jgi:hypothetical protein
MTSAISNLIERVAVPVRRATWVRVLLYTSLTLPSLLQFMLGIGSTPSTVLQPEEALDAFWRGLLSWHTLGTVLWGAAWYSFVLSVVKRASSPVPSARRLRVARPRTIRKAEHALDLLSSLVPKRIANEEIGDALEQIHAMAKARRPRWFIYLKVGTTFIWVTVHTGLHYAERIAGIIGKATGGKGD